MKKAVFAVLLAFLLLASGALADPSITKLEVTPNPVETEEDLSIGIEITESTTPTVEIRDAVTNQLLAALAAASATSQTLSYVPAKKGNYKLTAEIAQPCGVCEKTVYFSVIEAPVPAIPDMNAATAAIAAIAVIALIALKAQKVRVEENRKN